MNCAQNIFEFFFQSLLTWFSVHRYVPGRRSCTEGSCLRHLHIKKSLQAWFLVHTYVPGRQSCAEKSI